MIRRHLLILLATLLPSLAAAYDASAVLEARAGSLPLLLTVPHDGNNFLGFYPSRTQGATVRDVGTRAGLTASRLLGRFGPSALQGANSITGLLAARGYTVNPAPDAPDLKEDPRYAGGYTVFAYGSHRPEGIDAIQLEFGRQHRASSRLAEDLAAALSGFMASHALIAR